MKAAVDLVADLGEGFGCYKIADDSKILEVVGSANIACGFHAAMQLCRPGFVQPAISLFEAVGVIAKLLMFGL